MKNGASYFNMNRRTVMNCERRTNRMFLMAMGMLVTGVFSHNALAVQNDMRYSINLPVLIDNANNILGEKRDSIDALDIICAIATKSEAIHDDWKTFVFRWQNKEPGSVGSAQLVVSGKNTLLTNVHIVVDASYEQRVKNRRDHYACFIHYIIFHKNRHFDPTDKKNEKNLRIDQTKSVLKVTGKL